IDAKPGVERRFDPAIGLQSDPPPKFPQSDDADEKPILVGFMQKFHDLRTWMRFGDFGNHVGVDEKAHGCVSRASSFDRSRSRPTPLSGEARRNSAREPERAVFLSHSSTLLRISCSFLGEISGLKIVSFPRPL